MIFNKIFTGLTFLAIAVSLQSCKSEPESLADALVESWEEAEEGIEEYSEELCEEIENDPSQLLKGDCEAIYNPFSSNFTVTIPMSRSGYAAIGLIFGSDAADFLSTLESAGRESRSKEDIKKVIEKHFNPSWAGLMLALTTLDGELTYELETDSWSDASYDFSSKDLYRMLKDRNYFSGGYGDDIPE